MAHSQGLVNANAVFVKPAGFEAWEKTDLWRSVTDIPGVNISVDEDGVEAQRFRSETSGQVALYSYFSTAESRVREGTQGIMMVELRFSYC